MVLRHQYLKKKIFPGRFERKISEWYRVREVTRHSLSQAYCKRQGCEIPHCEYFFQISENHVYPRENYDSEFVTIHKE